MTVETGTYIDSLNAQFPPETDALSEIDEHLKIIKSTIKNTFPNVDAAVTATPAELNKSTAIVSDGTDATFNTGMTAAKIKTLVGISDPAITSGTDGNGDVVPSLAADISAAEVRDLIGAAEASSGITKLDVYPVGAIYMSVSNTTLPGDLFGGTWESIGQGRMLVGFDDATENADTDFTTAEATGGSKTHTLSVDEMPSHTHSMTIENSSGTGANGSADGASSFSTVDTSATGGGLAHNNMSPYLVVFMWKRVADPSGGGGGH